MGRWMQSGIYAEQGGTNDQKGFGLNYQTRYKTTSLTYRLPMTIKVLYERTKTV